MMAASADNGRKSSDSHNSSISSPFPTGIVIDEACMSSSSTLSVSDTSDIIANGPASDNCHEETEETPRPSQTSICPDSSHPFSSEGDYRDSLSETQDDDTNVSDDGFVIPFGIVNSSIILFSTSVSLIILGFLAFLWAGEGPVAGGEKAPTAWRYIVVEGWLFQAVAVSSTILRFTLSVQLPLTTCLVAALILERRAVPMSISAALSIYRGVNGGPPTLLHLLWSRKLFRIFLVPEMVLLSIIAVTTVIMQFSSTLLLSDIRDGFIIDLPRIIQPKMNLVDLGISTNAFTNALQKPLTEFPIFGEVPSNNISVTLNEAGLSTTGTRNHVVLPGGNNGEPVRSYDGDTITIASEVSCVPPVMDSLRLNSYWDNGTRTNHGRMIGEIDYDETFNRAHIRPQTDEVSTGSVLRDFMCSIASVSERGPGTTMCILNNPGHLWPTWNSTDSDSDDIWRSQSQVMLVFQNRYDMNITAPSGEVISADPSATRGEWQVFNLNGTSSEASLCFVRWKMRRSFARLSTDTHLERLQLPEGDLNISSSLGFEGFDAIKQTLGASRDLQSLPVQGVMKASSKDILGHGEFSRVELGFMDAVMTSMDTQQLSTNTSVSLCEAGASYYTETSLSLGLVEVFCDMARQMKSSAPLLLQTLIKIAGQSIYTQVEDSFSNSNVDARIVMEVTRKKPVHIAGLVSVAVLVFVSSACIVTIARLYLRYIRFTKIDNFWYTISQLVSEDTADTIMRSNLSPDEYILRDREGAEDHLIRLQLSEETGRVEIVRVEQGRDDR